MRGVKCGRMDSVKETAAETKDTPRSPHRWCEMSLNGAICFGGLAFAAFTLAALSWPGGGYNPLTRMLSALGRTTVRGVEAPWCHFIFMAAMFFAALGVVFAFAPDLRQARGWRRRAAGWGLALNVAGLVVIALVPENTTMIGHNTGCWGATLGGILLLVAHDKPGRDRAWTRVLAAIAAAFGTAVALHALHVARFVPWVTALQKAVIVAFALWTQDCALSRARSCGSARKAIRPYTWALLGFLLVLVVFRAVLAVPGGPPKLPSVCDASRPSAEVLTVPFSDDERAALTWLDHVTGPLPPEEERDWWHVGGGQFGLASKRYHIAFCGYAAAALGARGGEKERATAARILAHCIGRYLQREVWVYSMSKSYWGHKPWAPDPCWRENVMYTGHLLQLLALYETFSGDTRYWTEGWDFVWTDGRRVHYTVGKLIDTTVFQMRNGPTGGVTCEPGLTFFPCNNHPHFALALFARLGHGNWSRDAHRWERWALAHYARPLFGGGALNLVYHARSNLMFPRGHNGLDGWSLLWYEPWASDRRMALALWREASAKIDWATLEANAGPVGEFHPCLNPAPVPAVATASFLAAAAHACDDPGTAARLDALCDRALVRRDGLLYLDTLRDWRIGATANRIISLAEANGFRFRELLEP